MKKILLIVLCVPLIFNSCKKEDDSPNSNSPWNNPTTPSLGLIGYGSDEYDTYKTTDGGDTWPYINTQDFLVEDIIKINFSVTGRRK